MRIFSGFIALMFSGKWGYAFWGQAWITAKADGGEIGDKGRSRALKITEVGATCNLDIWRWTFQVAFGADWTLSFPACDLTHTHKTNARAQIHTLAHKHGKSSLINIPSTGDEKAKLFGDIYESFDRHLSTREGILLNKNDISLLNNCILKHINGTGSLKMSAEANLVQQP